MAAMAYVNSSRNTPDGTFELDSETLPGFADLMDGPQVAWGRDLIRSTAAATIG